MTRLLLHMASFGMNPETLRYIRGHSDISITLAICTYLKAENAQAEFGWGWELKIRFETVCLP